MASAITKAKNELVRLNNARKSMEAKRKAESKMVTQGAAVLAGAAGAALIDQKFAEEEGGVAELKGIPTNAIAGAAMVAGSALVKSLPFRGEIAGAGLGMASAALYNLVREHVDFE